MAGGVEWESGVANNFLTHEARASHQVGHPSRLAARKWPDRVVIMLTHLGPSPPLRLFLIPSRTASTEPRDQKDWNINLTNDSTLICHTQRRDVHHGQEKILEILSPMSRESESPSLQKEDTYIHPYKSPAAYCFGVPDTGSI